jgi:hypothetical protein
MNGTQHIIDPVLGKSLCGKPGPGSTNPKREERCRFCVNKLKQKRVAKKKAEEVELEIAEIMNQRRDKGLRRLERFQQLHSKKDR